MTVTTSTVNNGYIFKVVFTHHVQLSLYLRMLGRAEPKLHISHTVALGIDKTKSCDSHSGNNVWNP